MRGHAPQGGEACPDLKNTFKIYSDTAKHLALRLWMDMAHERMRGSYKVGCRINGQIRNK
jgi:hypothetical protein